MADIDEQRKRVEELKRKILEQKKVGGGAAPSDLPVNKPLEEPKERTVPAASQPQEIKPQIKKENQPKPEEVVRPPEKSVLQQKEGEKPRREEEKPAQVQHAVPVVSLQAYAQALKQAWSNGSVSADEESILLTLRKSMGISDEVHESLEQEAQLEIYLYAMIDCWKDGSLTTQDFDKLDSLREKFGISAEEHMRLEKQVRHEILKQR
jgi:hypothetical protein